VTNLPLQSSAIFSNR